MRKIFLVYLLPLLILISGCTKEQDKNVRVLRLGYNLSVSHPFHKVMLAFKKQVEEMSHGKLEHSCPVLLYNRLSRSEAEVDKLKISFSIIASLFYVYF